MQISNLLTRKYPIGLIPVLLLSFSLKGPAQPYDLHTYTDALAQPYVYTMIEDNLGYLCIGTGKGLSRYNGFSFSTLTTDDSLAGNFITSSFKKGDDLWFGHMNGRITHYKNNIFSPVAGVDLKSAITAIEESPDSIVWAATFNNGLVNLMQHKDDAHVSSPMGQVSVYSFKFLTENTILAGSADGLKYCRVHASGEIEELRRVDGIPRSKVPTVIKMRNDSGFYIATENEGIFKLLPDGERFVILSVTEGMNSDLTGVQSVFEDSRNDLWISTFGKGLIKLTGLSPGGFGDALYFNEETGFPGNYVKTVYEDREGNIWSGNYGTGLTRITGKLFSFFTMDKSLAGTVISAVYADQNDVWIGTEKGLGRISQTEDNVVECYFFNQGFPTDKITALYSNERSDLWIGTETNGLYRKIAGNKFIRPYPISDGTLENTVTSISGSGDQLWIGTKKGVCNLNTTTGELTWFSIEKGGLPHNSVNDVFVDSKKRVWVSATGTTLTYIQHGKVEKIPIRSESKMLSMGPIAEDRDSAIWVGSYGGGVFRLGSDSIANISSKDGLISNYCYSLLADDRNNIWVGHQGGLSRVRTTDLFVKSFQEYIGINNTCELSKNAITMDKQKKVWFGSDEGLLVYNPEQEKRVLVPPVLSLTEITVNDEAVGLTNRLILSPGKYKLRIKFLGISLSEPSNVKYKYQLMGYDMSPVITTSGSAVYPALSDGRYTFMVWSASSNGVITKDPLSVRILIKQPVWKQWWFYIAMIILVAAGVIAIVKRREYRYQREKEHLESRVKERTSELAKSNALLNEKQELITDQNKELLKYRNYLEELVEERTRELMKAKDKAEESDRLKTAFLQNMSHEIRTPMNGILGFLGLLKESGLNTQEKNQYIDIINDSGARLLDTINDIVEISKIESKQITIHNTVVNIKKIMDHQLNFFELQAKNKGLVLKCSVKIQDDKAIVETDKYMLNSILTNLINNALKFTKTGSVEFGNYLEDNTILFYVKDTGIGIPVNRREAIFERFVQADMANTRSHEGSGLGLSIAKAYVEALKGKIWVESKVDSGSTFWFSIPYTPITIQEEKPTDKGQPENLAGKRITILIAEDDEYSYLYVNSILKKFNTHLLHATNGHDFLNLFMENPEIALLLVDIKMPGMDGLELTRKIRQLNKTIPIIAQTAYAMPGDKEKAMETGCTEYIIKPINADHLLEVVQKYIR